MKKTVFGISMLVLAAVTAQVSAQAQIEQTPAPTQAAPGSMDKIKEKIEAMNSHSTGLDGVVKMYQSGVDKAVIETYIKNSRLTSPTPRDIIYLHDQGVPQEVVNALIDRGRTVDEENAKNAAAAQPTTVVAPNAGGGYNTYVDNGAMGTAPYAGYDYSSYANNNVTIIPYNPYRSYGSYYSPPFYSWNSYYWPYSSYYGPYSSYYWNDYYRPYYRGAYVVPYGPRSHFGFSGSFGAHRGPIFIGGSHFGGSRFGSHGGSFGGHSPSRGGLHGGFRR